MKPQHLSVIVLLLFFSSPLVGQDLERDDFPLGKKIELVTGPKESAPAFRVQSFGNTQFNLEMACPSCSQESLKLFVEGPLPEYGDKTPIGSGPKFLELKANDKNKIEKLIELKEQGIYRFIIASKADPNHPEAKIILSTDHLENTVRPSETLPQMMGKLRAAERGKILRSLEKQIRHVVPDPKTHGPILERLKKIEEEKDWNALERFPTFPPPNKIKQFRPLLDGFKQTQSAASSPIVTELTSYIQSGTTDRDQKGDLLLSSPYEVRYGHYNSQTIAKEILDQSPKVSELLNSLSLHEQSLVTFKDPKQSKQYEIRSPKDFFDFLIQTGHQIELREERTYANFLALEFQNKYSQIPVWMNTGIKLPDGTELKVPLSHSHLSWHIKGPLVNARVAFFLGLYGVGFFPQTDERPAWTGLVTKQSFSSDNGNQDLILRSAEAAQAYMQRIKIEKEKIDGGLPADGYGTLGVCNDSTTAMLARLGIQSESSYPFPLVRSSRLPDVGTGAWEQVFKQLPKDTELTQADLQDEPRRKLLLCRILATTPYPLDSPYFPDEELRRQLKLAADYTKDFCRPSQVRTQPKTH